MPQQYDFSRFLSAQQYDYAQALQEIRAGHKRSHWIWYIFPQLDGLGSSGMSRMYALHSLDEAAAYLREPVLSARLIEICEALMTLITDNPHEVMGYPDDMKLCSSMTLFSLVPGAPDVFRRVLDKFYGGRCDSRTIQLLGLDEAQQP